MAPSSRKPEGDGAGLAIGALLEGKYRLQKELGRGTFGVVFEALDEFLDRKVAIKAILTRWTAAQADTEAFEHSFNREARLAARLHHENIVAVYGSGRVGGANYIVFEFVPGTTLRNRLLEVGRLSWSEAQDVVDQLLRGLDYAHELGVVHRDLKPDNLLLRDDGVLKIADFGIAKPTDMGSGTLTQEGFMVGTPHYMSPEQIRAEPTGPTADIFSGAALIYEVLAGKKPFAGGSDMEVLKKVVDDPAPPLDPRLKVPRRVQQAIQKALSKKPEDRFARALEFLNEMMESSTTPEAVEGPAQELPAETPVSPPTPEPSAAPAPKSPTESVLELPLLWIPPDLPNPPDVAFDLPDCPPPELLLQIRRERESGLLVVDGEDWSMGIDFSAGHPIGAVGGPTGHELGVLMRRLNMLDDTSHRDLLEAFGKAEPGIPIGQIAVRRGFLQPLDLLRALEAQVDARVDILLGETAGSARFHRGMSTGHFEELAARPLEILVKTGLLTRPEVLSRLISRFVKQHGERYCQPRVEVSQLLERFRFGARVHRLVKEMTGQSVHSIVGGGASKPGEPELAVYLLWVLGGIELREDAPAPKPASPEPAIPALPPPAAPEPRSASKPPSTNFTAPPPTPSTPVSSTEVRAQPPPTAPPEPRAAPKVERLEPDLGELLASFGRAMQGQDWVQARSLLAQARARLGDDPEELVSFGSQILSAAGSYPEARDEAQRAFSRALESIPESLPALVGMAELLRRQGSLDEAKQHLDRAMEVDPRAPALRVEREALFREMRRQSSWRRGISDQSRSGTS